jgi:hypothetical protein
LIYAGTVFLRCKLENAENDPRVPDHFSEDIVAEIGEDGSYSKVYLSAKHGSEFEQ